MQIDAAAERSCLWGAPLFQAHLPLSGAGLLCLPLEGVLPVGEIDFSDQVSQLRQAWPWTCGDIWGSFWSLCADGADPPAP